MKSSSDLKSILFRTEKKIDSTEFAIARIKNEIFAIEKIINNHDEAIKSARLLLNSLSVYGYTTLSELIEIKARQASIKRTIALSELQMKDGEQTLKKVNAELQNAREEKIILQRKHDKFAQHIQLLDKIEQKRMHNFYDNETEEFINWKYV